MDRTLEDLANQWFTETFGLYDPKTIASLGELLGSVHAQARQEGFAEAREMAAREIWELRDHFREAGRFGDGDVNDPIEFMMIAKARKIRALQPPRDEGKREGGDG